MEEIKPERSEKKTNAWPLIVLVQVMVAAGIVGLGWWYVNKKSNETSKTIENISQSVAHLGERVNVQADRVERLENPNPNEVLSGFKLYSVVFPDGWGDITRTTDSDLIVIKGKKQPIKKEGENPVIKDVPGDALVDPYVFAIQFFGNLEKPEEATVTDFTVGTGVEKIIGKKYAYTYSADTNDRKKGDKDYQYRLPIKNGDQDGELVIFYKVYSADTNDQVNTVDDIVRSINFKR